MHKIFHLSAKGNLVAVLSFEEQQLLSNIDYEIGFSKEKEQPIVVKNTKENKEELRELGFIIIDESDFKTEKEFSDFLTDMVEGNSWSRTRVEACFSQHQCSIFYISYELI